MKTHDVDGAEPWYRQFWPWFLIALPGAAVIGSLATVWIAIDARPDRIDGYGAIAVPVELSADRKTLTLDFGLPVADERRPESITITLVSRSDGDVQELTAIRLDERFYETAIGPLLPGAHDVMLRSSGETLQGTWSYPVPVWKLRRDD